MYSENLEWDMVIDENFEMTEKNIAYARTIGYTKKALEEEVRIIKSFIKTITKELGDGNGEPLKLGLIALPEVTMYPLAEDLQ